MDNVLDQSLYPHEDQRLEAQQKRRMGLGVTGLANAGEALGYKYGGKPFRIWAMGIMRYLRDTAYLASIGLARDKGPFPLFVRDSYLDSEFVKRLPHHIQDGIRQHGIRNSHLISIAPTGTISMAADNVSTGLEPPFSLSYTRTIQTPEGPVEAAVEDYAAATWGIKGVTADELTPEQHVDVLTALQPYVDSGISKTVNVGDDVDFERFKDVYLRAYNQGAKGMTTFRMAGKRYALLKASVEEVPGEACYINPETGEKECS